MIRRLYWFWKFWRGVGGMTWLPFRNRVLLCWGCAVAVVDDERGRA